MSVFKMHKCAVNKMLIISEFDPKEFVSSDIQGNIYRTFVEKESLLNKYIGNYEKNKFF